MMMVAAVPSSQGNDVGIHQEVWDVGSCSLAPMSLTPGKKGRSTALAARRFAAATASSRSFQVRQQAHPQLAFISTKSSLAEAPVRP